VVRRATTELYHAPRGREGADSRHDHRVAQAGSYGVMVLYYRRIGGRGGPALTDFEKALTVVATVVSVPVRRPRDGGRRAEGVLHRQGVPAEDTGSSPRTRFASSATKVERGANSARSIDRRQLHVHLARSRHACAMREVGSDQEAHTAHSERATRRC
jgi:hypothetical protein